MDSPSGEPGSSFSPQQRPPGQTTIFTIVSCNYISFAATLMQSVRQHMPDVQRIIVLADAARDFPGIDLAADVLTCDQLGFSLIGNMKLWYSVMEFNTAIKPYVFRHLFRDRNVDRAIYVDPDIALFAPLVHVMAGLDDHSLVLTPHMTAPLQDGKEPSDLAIMKSGVYNLGFAAMRNDADASRLVDWWCDRLFAHCRVDIAGNMFTDQRWMDLAPAFVERFLLLRHPGYNAAYWNVAHRRIERGLDGWTANGQTLHFYHFSGVEPNDPRIFSKHQNRFTMDDVGELADLFTAYRGRVLDNGWQETHRIPYAYGTFRDGRPIEGAMRRWLTRAVDDDRLSSRKKLRINASFFDAPDDAVQDPGLTRFSYQFWLDRVDLEAAFDIRQPAGLISYRQWLTEGSAAAEGMHPANVAAVAALANWQRAAVINRIADPPWPSVSRDCWSGLAAGAGTWLSSVTTLCVDGDSFAVPRAVALLWERRADLQQHFALESGEAAEAYLSWALTSGILEGSIAPDLLAGAFAVEMDSPSRIAGLWSDIPVTRLMVLLRRNEHRRFLHSDWTRFPADHKAQLDQAFWCAFTAPQHFGWPDRMVASLRQYFANPSDIAISDYALSLGALGLWRLRDDLQSAFPLSDETSRLDYLLWLIRQCTVEYGIPIALLCPGLREFLQSPSRDWPGLTRFAELVHRDRADLRDSFDLVSAEARKDFAEWLDADDGTLWRSLTGDTRPPPALRPVHCAVVLAGDWTLSSGIGEDLRCTAAALDACGFTDYLVLDMVGGTLHRPGGQALQPGTPVHAAWLLMHRNAETAMADWLRARSLGVTATTHVGHWHWELERLPSTSRHAFGFCDEIWASTAFAAEAFAAEDLRPIRVIPGAIRPPKRERAWSRRELGLDTDATVFLFVFDFGSFATRKNPLAVIRAFELAFPLGSERAQLVIKTQNAAVAPALWSEVSGWAESDPRIVILDRRLERDALTGLFDQCDAFVSLHRSEGFGRAPAEAMLLGRPVIVTAYSGTNDYTDDDCACRVGYTLVPVGPDEYPGVEAQRWAEPDLDDAARYMRWIHDKPADAKALGERGRERILRTLSLERVGQQLLAALLPGEQVRSSRPILVE